MTATADVITLPGVKLTATQRLSYDERVRQLESLVRQAQWLEPEKVTALRDMLAHDSHSKTERERAWAAVLDAVTIADGIEIGVPVDWDWRCASCGHPFARGCECGCCPSALQHARDVAAEALAYLAGGAR